MSKTNPTSRYGNMHRSDRHHGAEALSCGALHTNAERAEEQVMTRRTEAINTIESDGRYDFAARVMTRRTEAINNIESEGRDEYAARVMTRRTEAINNIESEGRDAERVTVKSAETNTKNTHKRTLHGCGVLLSFMARGVGQGGGQAAALTPPEPPTAHVVRCRNLTPIYCFRKTFCLTL